MVFGTFDIFHPGHADFFKQACQYGDRLIVVVARDETVKKIKGKLPENNEKKRLEKVQRSELVDKAVLGRPLQNINTCEVIKKENEHKGQYEIIREYNPDVICLGYDQKFFTEKLQENLSEFGLDKTEIVRLKSFNSEKYKSSKLKN